MFLADDCRQIVTYKRTLILFTVQMLLQQEVKIRLLIQMLMLTANDTD